MSLKIVGIGASAGGLEELKILLKNLSAKTGCAFVFIQHLEESHKSSLPEILSTLTSMKVLEIKDGLEIKKNHFYTIPSKSDAVITDGKFKLMNRKRISGQQHLPIDLFFKSLAKEQGSEAIAVLLSGMGQDGTQGMEAIKKNKGITIIQDPSSTSFDQMPLSALKKQVVDYVLETKAIGKLLSQKKITKKQDSIKWQEPKKAEPLTKLNVTEILLLLKKKFNTDFTNYKDSTIHRRILRRMNLIKIKSSKTYANHLKKHPEELSSLYADLLINVTEFFRDKEIFKSLKKNVFPQILKDKKSGDSIRIWVPGCATGEEVYSIAIALVEFLGKKIKDIKIQIFATDISESSISKARLGEYTTSQLQGVSPERLRLYFRKKDDKYQINKNIRELCVFAVQNLVSDPPFSKMDLISCRNLLIYLDKNLQKKVIPIFHYALKPNRFLLLGISESISNSKDLFKEVDSKNKIYLKLSKSNLPILNFSSRYVPLEIPEFKNPKGRFESIDFDIKNDLEKVILSQINGVVVDSNSNIVHTFGNVTPYLTLNVKYPTMNVLKLSRDYISFELRSLMQKAIKTKKSVIGRAHNKSKKQVISTIIEVVPLQINKKKPTLYLIQFINDVKSENEAFLSANTSNKLKTKDSRLVDELKKKLVAANEEVHFLKRSLENSLEVLEENNEKLYMANEEIMSSNEELQSTNEELETAKEELQSTNEELSTVNQELQNRNDELKLTNDDLMNLMNSVKIPVVMLGKDLCIRRYTSTAQKILNIISTDIGRPFSDLALKINVPNLKDVIYSVLDNMTPQEMEVQDEDKRWYRMRVHPYRTQDDRLDGVVISFMDIHALKTALTLSQSIVETVRNPLVVLNKNLNVLKVNKEFCKTFNAQEKDFEGKNIFLVSEGQWNIPEFNKLLTEDLIKESYIYDLEITHDFKSIGERHLLVNARRAFVDILDKDDLIFLSIEDVTEKKKHEDKLESITKKLIEANSELEQFAYITSHDLQEPLRMVSLYMELLASQSQSKLDVEDLEYIRIAIEGTRRMKLMIEDLLAFAKSSRSEVSFGPADTNQVLKSVLSNLQVMINETKTLVKSESLPKVDMSEVFLTEILQNLVCNAIKFNKNQQPIIKISAQQKKQFWEFCVSDNGIGIKKEDQTKIFDIFKRLNNGDEYPGTGIGLAMCKKIVERYGGSIWVDSEIGIGSSFYFTIPIRS